ncbi:FAD-dependent oxidoreductase [Spirochaeta cellobiosiphila]|uniref:FAD-dependent oxidoreductase n=1 Tax=Spirochaeta cellobiosiphila TaxID=504483 RepID=UPI001FE1FDF2|nr:FAD-dependent oxidoreductase [Spirochaeta cellobiosiphila]
MRNIVILGGGYGGVAAAKKLLKGLKKQEATQITLIDRNPFHTLMTELHEVAGGRVEEDSIRISLKKIFAGTAVHVVIDEIENIDFDQKVLSGRDKEYKYDYLVMGVGAEPEFFGVTGAQDHSFTLWSYNDAIKLREHIENCFLEASRTSDLIKRQQLLTFVVAGAGFTGVEMLGELLEWKKKLCGQYDVKSDEVRVILVEAQREILPMLPRKLRDKSVKFIEKKGGEILLDSAITEVTADDIKISDLSIATKTLVWSCGVKGSAFAGELKPLHETKKESRQCQNVAEDGTCSDDTNLRFNIQKKCRVITNEYMQSEAYENVYIIGDVTWHLEGHKTLPQIVETALQTGECAASNIIADIQGKDKKAFKSNYHGYMVSIGSKYAVANLMGMMMSGFMAMAMKHIVNLHYLWSVTGFNGCWEYLMARFFGIKERRSMIGGFASNKIHTFWLFPLRMFVGAKWLIEGIMKVQDGWLSPDNIFIMPVDGASAASEEVAETVNQAAQAVQPLLSEPFFLYTWFMDAIVAKAPFLFQASAVFAEIGIGLALIGGLFTFLAALVSIGLGLMFTLGAMAGAEMLWYMMAAVALMGGAGNFAGLDYWVMPFLGKYYKKIPFIKKHHLFTGE